MVRVFSVYHYRGQTIDSYPDDVLAASLINRTNQLILGKPNHLIEIRSLDDPVEAVSFATVDEIQQLIYCDQGNYIGTIEYRPAGRRNLPDKYFCRIYTNWNEIGTTDIRARVADKVTPSITGSGLEVIEIPIIQNIQQISCCQMTGTLMIAAGPTISLWKLLYREHPGTKYQYIDFQEIPCQIDLDFTPIRLAICENILAAQNSESAAVFRVLDGAHLQSDEISATSLTSELSGIVDEQRFECLDFEKIDPMDITVDLKSNFDGFKNQIEQPITVEYQFKVRIFNPGHEFLIKPLLQLRVRDLMDPFRCLQLRGISIDSMTDTTELVKSKCTIAVGCLLATANDGYLYQFNNNDKWSRDHSNGFLSTYPFTSQLIDASMNDYVVHALTDRGIETYTHRLGHRLFANTFEYKMADDSFTVEACPSVDDSICLIGLRPFFGVERMLCNNDRMVLLAANNEDASNQPERIGWTIYNLKLPSPIDLYVDFTDVAVKHRQDAPTTYQLLLSEAHVIVRIAKEFYRSKIDQLIEETFIESCRLLGDFFILSENREEFCLAFPYYTMGRLSITQIYDRYPAERSVTPGFVATIKSMFLRLPDRSEIIGRLLLGVYPQTGQTFGDEMIRTLTVYGNHELAALTLRSPCFRDIMSGKVAEAIKRTDWKQSDEDRLCLLLDAVRSDKKSEALDILTDMSDVSLITILTRHWECLFDIPDKKSMIAFSELTENYLLTELIPDDRKQWVKDCFERLLTNRIVTIDLLLKLFMDHLAASVGQATYLIGQSILERLLEVYLSKFYAIDHQNDSLTLNVSRITLEQKSESIFDDVDRESMKILLRIYLAKFKQLSTEDDSQIGSETVQFDRYFKYMRSNLTVIIQNHQTIRTDRHIDDKQSILFLQRVDPYIYGMINGYNDHLKLILMKISGLLSSGKLSNGNVQEIVQFLTTSGHLIGLNCLMTILLPPIKTIEYLIDFEPETLVFYSKYRLEEVGDWSELLMQLILNRTVIINRHSDEFYTKILCDILDLIVEIKPLKDILKILPYKNVERSAGSGGPPEYYLRQLTDDTISFDVIPYESRPVTDIEDRLIIDHLKRAIDQDRAERLGDMIKTTGDQLFESYRQFFN